MSNAAASTADSWKARRGSATSSPRSGMLGLGGRRLSPLAARGDIKGSFQIFEQLVERSARAFRTRPKDMRNDPCFLECSGELSPPSRGADDSDAELLEAEQPGRLSPDREVRLELPVQHGEGL